ncbi:MAG TPA: hypothetical protein VF601_21445 [Beijerinckiaceae bacterium]|jgi:hypothetical protein
MNRSGFGANRLLAWAACAAVAAAAPASAQSIGDTLSNLFKFGGTTEPKEAPRETGDVYCPTVGIIEGGAALRAYTGGKVGEPSALRHQIAIGQLARECAEQPDGSILVRVGVEGRALLGPAGQAGRFDAPVTFVLKRGDRILATRTQRISVAVPAGDTQGSFVTVQDGLVVPAGVGEYEIDVGLIARTGEKPERPARRKRG